MLVPATSVRGQARWVEARKNVEIARVEIGQTFASLDGSSDVSQAVLISASLWRRRFAADPAVVGKTIALDGDRRTVAGVLPDGFNFPGDLLGRLGQIVPRVDL